MGKKLKAYIQLHIAVLLYGLTAILGDLISISAMHLVWWRVLITSLSLLFFINFFKEITKMPKKLLLTYIGIGCIVGLHWIAFYGAIKLSNASITLAAMATTSLFTSIIEPFITRKKFERSEFLLGLLVVPPMLLIAQNVDLTMHIGILVAILSAFLASLFSSLNKKWVNHASPYQISFLEMSSAFIMVSIILPFFTSSLNDLKPSPNDWIYLLILSLLCTTFAYVISMKALKHVSAFDATLVINLEPVYGILLAIVILKEHQELTPMFYLGVFMIMVVVFAHPIIQKIKDGKSKSK